MQPLLQLIDVSKSYRHGDITTCILKSVNLAITQGEFVAFLGQSGSGKSTLMNILGCLDTVSTGQYKVNGVDVAALAPDALAALRRDTFGFVFQRYNLLNNATAIENVEIPAIYAGVTKKERHIKAQALLGKLGLQTRIGHRPSQLSGGQQQRVAIARALINDAPVILADEPTGALDTHSGQEVLALLKQLHQEGHTVLLITHDTQIAQQAERIVRVHDGEIALGASQPATSSSGKVTGAVHKQTIWPAVSEIVRMSMKALRSNIFRTVLTLLGVMIGVAAVVAMLAIGKGSEQQVLERISSMGTHILVIRPGAPGVRVSGEVATLTTADAEMIRQLPNIRDVSPERGAGVTMRYGNVDYTATVRGVWPSYTKIRNWPLAQGDFFGQADLARYAPVIVLGSTVAKNLFADTNPIGQYLLVSNIPFEIIGVLQSQGASVTGADQDDVAFVPLTTGFMRIFGKQYMSLLTVQMIDERQSAATEAAIKAALLAQHGIEDFQIRNMASIMAMLSDTQNTLTLLLGSVAAISLLVGGIGVMNIMLVSVTERTREIGIRMATGARVKDILWQFNIEAILVCGLGGVLGVIIGFAITALLRYMNVPVVFSVWPALIAFACAFITGCFFGYLPARKAAKLDPVVALSAQ